MCGFTISCQIQRFLIDSDSTRLVEREKKTWWAMIGELTKIIYIDSYAISGSVFRAETVDFAIFPPWWKRTGTGVSIVAMVTCRLVMSPRAQSMTFGDVAMAQSMTPCDVAMAQGMTTCDVSMAQSMTSCTSLPQESCLIAKVCLIHFHVFTLRMHWLELLRLYLLAPLFSWLLVESKGVLNICIHWYSKKTL